MKRRYSLLSIIGKTSKIRFPHHIDIPLIDKLSFVLPANEVMSEPPLSTALAMIKADAAEFCDQFNDDTLEHEEGLPLHVFIYASAGGFLFEIKTPPVLALFNIIFDLDDIGIENFRAFGQEILLALCNFGLIKQNPHEDFFESEIISSTKSIYGTFFSYNAKRKFLRKAVLKKSKKLQHRFYIQAPRRSSNILRYLRTIRKKCRSTMRKAHIKYQNTRRSQFLDYIDSFELWEDFISPINKNILKCF